MPETSTSPTATVSRIVVRPLTPRFGAVVRGVDAKDELDAETVSRLLALLMQHKVLFFRDQHLSLDQHHRFATYFGEPSVEAFTRAIDGYPGLSHLDAVPFFHSDLMQMEDPPKFSMLQMSQVPEVGGDTMWADLVGSYQALSPALRGFLETLTGTYSFARYEGDGSALARERVARTGRDYEETLRVIQPTRHPIVRRIPETGDVNYWVSQAFTKSINELTPAESQALLEYLFRHQMQPQFIVRWNWKAGDIAFWDHRTTLHSGVTDYGDAKRQGVRASLSGGRPIPV